MTVYFADNYNKRMIQISLSGEISEIRRTLNYSRLK